MFDFLRRTWTEDGESYALAAKYFNLALACAVVFDKKLRLTNPSSLGDSVHGIGRYQWYYEKMARKAVQDIELAFKRVVETGTKEWFRAKTEVSLHKLIC